MRGRRFDTGEYVELKCEAGRLATIAPISADVALPWLAPSFIDLQVNGYGGHAFNDPQLSLEKIVAVSNAMRQQGVGQYLPTCTTQSTSLLIHSFEQLANACSQAPAETSNIAGFHLEGPYISPLDGPRGAHPREHVRPPSWTEFQRLQEAAGGRIKLITLSPEYSEAPAFIENAVQSGVVVAIGHTSANSEQIAAAVSAGASLSTHLGNGCHLQIKRHPNYLWDQLAEDRLCCSLIADGHHLPPAVLKSFVRAKLVKRCLLISDYTDLAGCTPGCYRTSLGEVELLPEGKLVVAGQRELLAGATQPLTVGIENMLNYAEVSLHEAIDMVTTNPARLMGWNCEFFATGARFDFVRFEIQEGRFSFVSCE
jgi:N-acetylglucosamine-6-phosphate deacetylase